MDWKVKLLNIEHREVMRERTSDVKEGFEATTQSNVGLNSSETDVKEIVGNSKHNEFIKINESNGSSNSNEEEYEEQEKEGNVNSLNHNQSHNDSNNQLRNGVNGTHKQSGEGKGFEDLLLNERVVKGIHEQGFYSPSPIQAKVIPIAKFGIGTFI